MGSFELPERSRRLLATLVREYIDSGEPVSSQIIAHRSGLGLSSATVRNVLAQLEEHGYVHQPHTSAGRVPTDLGYRVFVDMLLESRMPAVSHDVEQQLRRQQVQTPLMDDLLAAVSHLVSRAAKHVGFALSADDAAVLQRIEFIPLDGSQILVVVVARNNQVTQKVVDAGERIRPDDLAQAARYLNTEFAGLPLFEVRDAVQERLRQERTLYDQLLARALKLAHSTLQHLPNVQTIHLDGAASLLDHGPHEGVSAVTLRALFEMMEEKERMMHLLNAYIDGPGLTVVIGTEHTSPDLRRFSLIACTAVEGSTTRTVGVIGPTRMHYSRTIALVDGTTQAVSRVLRDAH
ncbi:MAG TPA: heat-inducible transcriptional repressor HrcA [Vicinamibacterales bacterium]|nr:heat-inducible transcriptional repressor HrcA [Vicinamibacterales bacterium]